MNMASLTLNREEAEHMRHMEQLRQQDHEFFTIVFNGPVLRIHCLKNIGIRESRDMQGKVSYVPVERDCVVEPPNMEPNPNTGRYEAQVYLDPEEYNLFWLSRNAETYEIEILDEKVSKRIEALKSKEFKMPDGEKELLMVEKRRIDRELRRIEEKEKIAEEAEKRAKKGKVKAAEMQANQPRPEPAKQNKPQTPFTKV